MVASVEAIFLSTFILITQNRMAAAAHRRAELALQVSPLAEAEITKLVELVSEIADRMNVPAAEQEDLEEMKRMVAPEAVRDAIEENAVDWTDSASNGNQALTAVVMFIARAAKSSASLECQARACSVTARCAAMRSWTSRRR